MLNVQALTQTLSAMPLNQLQQYAQLHRNDPYVVTMALSIANQKKQAMTAQQGQAGQQPQPKVVDSEIAQMAPQQMPEDQGIGQLPAGNMDFADGGIVGYADGGHVERYAGGGELLRTTTGGKSWFLDVPSTMRDPSVPYYREIPSPFVGLADKQFASKEEALAAYNQLAQPAAPKTTPTYSPADYSGMDRRIMSGSQQPTIPSISPPAVTAASAAAPIADNTRRAAPGAAPVAGPKQPAQAGLGDLSTMYADILKKQKYTDPAEDKLKSLEAKELSAAEESKAALLRDQAKFDDAYKGREQRLSDRETDLGKQKDTNTGLAFLNAGLAIMSTPGGLAAAVGKGARVGTEQFAAGLDKIRSAKERLDEARDKMEDLKLNRAEMSAKEIRAAEKDIRSVGIVAEQRGIEGLRMAAGVTEKRAETMLKSMVEVGVNRERMASAENIAGMQERGANARATQMPKEMQTAMMLGTGNTDKEKLESGLRRLQEVQAGKFNVSSSYADYLKAFAGKDTLTPPLTFANYAAQFGAVLPR
jgi:hypothetical protein